MSEKTQHKIWGLTQITCYLLFLPKNENIGFFFTTPDISSTFFRAIT